MGITLMVRGVGGGGQHAKFVNFKVKLFELFGECQVQGLEAATVYRGRWGRDRREEFWF